MKWGDFMPLAAKPGGQKGVCGSFTTNFVAPGSTRLSSKGGISATNGQSPLQGIAPLCNLKGVLCEEFEVRKSTTNDMFHDLDEIPG